MRALLLSLLALALPSVALAGDVLAGVEVGSPLVAGEWSARLANGHYSRDGTWAGMKGLVEVEPCGGKVHMVRFVTGFSTTPQVGTIPSADPMADLVASQLTATETMTADGWKPVDEGRMEVKPEGSTWNQGHTKGSLHRIMTAVVKPDATMLGVTTVPPAACTIAEPSPVE